MSLIKLNNRLFRPAWSSMLDDFFTDNFSSQLESMSIPAANIEEKDNAFEIKLAAPGLKKDDFKIEIENGILSISSESEQSDEEENKDFRRKEYSYSSFSRSFSLPENIHEDQIEASYKEGELILTLPKKAIQTQNTKKIEVS